ncbi:dihydrofolate reductase [Gordonia pseudamarae]|jgi:dihydrofolate reductase|uniref:Dihydrofolate reductase n=1 Tax=Gordonia pseudamarae TaxID=2831662 RepID=A0ABX6IK74_9ACTN|nr:MULTISPECIES: dihydrofolate reductase family protein [Gordonia]MBD0022564.1 dihydrofolate reductase family protein [Gordonia sp. (in: high G+C Gram-positive bacteria)]QHN26868.1 dihydrofolate reductase [Gordonia pseudamarae]QHN35759.1 dihydrofolate reductase [Gordonia pseudamarae]
MARTVSAHLFHSINGVVESPDQWQFDCFGAEEGQAMGAAIGDVTDVIIGRKLWDEWREYWPCADDPFGAWINPVRKHVLSRTLTGEVPWNSVAIDGDPIDYVKALRAQGDGGISVAGGIDTVRLLFLGGVVDTLTLTTHPVVAGVGRQLFDDSVPTTRLALVDAVPTAAGNVMHTYTLRADN